jgi:hypothetical protein
MPQQRGRRWRTAAWPLGALLPNSESLGILWTVPRLSLAMRGCTRAAAARLLVSNGLDTGLLLLVSC